MNGFVRKEFSSGACWIALFLEMVHFQVYVGHIPHELFEDSIVPLFEQCGKIWDLRLMMDPMSGKNRGYAFLTFCEKASAAEAAKKVIFSPSVCISLASRGRS